MEKREDLDYLISNIKFYDEVPQSARQKILAVGPSKTGKTRFGGTIEKKAESLFIIDTDGSLDGLPADKKHSPFISISRDDVLNRRVKVFDTVDSVIRRLRDHEEPFSTTYPAIHTLMIDGITTLADLMLVELMLDSRVGKQSRDPLTEKPTYDEYGVLKNRLNTIFTKIDDLDINTYVTAGVAMDSDDVTSINIALPNIVGSFRSEASHRFNAVLYFIEEGGKYYAYTKSHFKFPAGIRNWCGEAKVENPSFDRIFGDPKNFTTGGQAK